MEKTKPLGRKAYGSIGHLPESRMGPGDHMISPGQARIATERVRDKNDRITVTEKLDGSCVAVARVDGAIVPLGRAGWTALSSPHRQHRMFAEWAFERQDRFEFLDEGERVVGEWLAQAHGTRYVLEEREPFAVFDVFDSTSTRVSYETMLSRTQEFNHPSILSDGPAFSLEDALGVLGEFGWYGAVDPVEGVVWRVERSGKFDYLCKYVRPDKIDGLYLPDVEGSIVDEIQWNYQPTGSR